MAYRIVDKLLPKNRLQPFGTSKTRLGVLTMNRSEDRNYQEPAAGRLILPVWTASVNRRYAELASQTDNFNEIAAAMILDTKAPEECLMEPVEDVKDRQHTRPKSAVPRNRRKTGYVSEEVKESGTIFSVPTFENLNTTDESYDVHPNEQKVKRLEKNKNLTSSSKGKQKAQKRSAHHAHRPLPVFKPENDLEETATSSNSKQAFLPEESAESDVVVERALNKTSSTPVPGKISRVMGSS